MGMDGLEIYCDVYKVWMLLRGVDDLLKDKLEEIVNVLCPLFDLALSS